MVSPLERKTTRQESHNMIHVSGKLPELLEVFHLADTPSALSDPSIDPHGQRHEATEKSTPSQATYHTKTVSRTLLQIQAVEDRSSSS